MSGIQTLLIVVVISLTILLVVVGIQVILAVIDIRRAIRRLNSLLEDAILGGGLIKPAKLTGILEMFRKKKKLETREQGDIQDLPPSSLSG